MNYLEPGSGNPLLVRPDTLPAVCLELMEIGCRVWFAETFVQLDDGIEIVSLALE